MGLHKVGQKFDTKWERISASVSWPLNCKDLIYPRTKVYASVVKAEPEVCFSEVIMRYSRAQDFHFLGPRLTYMMLERERSRCCPKSVVVAEMGMSDV